MRKADKAEKEAGPRALHRKQLSTSVNNIRQSGYKIMRGTSNRTAHSLEAKKPIFVLNKNQSASKIRFKTSSKQVPQTPMHVPNIETQKMYHSAETNANRDCLNQTYIEIKQQESFVKESKPHPSELQCMQAIWQNLKILKARGIFVVEVLELECILEKMVMRLAQEENCLSYMPSPNKQPCELKATNQSDNVISARVDNLFESAIEEKKVNYIIEGNGPANIGKESVRSSYDSLKIENEESHKLEFLDLYRQEGEGQKLRDITHSCRINTQQSNSSSLRGKDSTFRREEKSQWEDRIYLRSIVKRSKRDHKQNSGSSSQSECCQDKAPMATSISGGQGVTNLNISYECRLFECDSKKEVPSSSGSSESKRQVLNQIISMLNHKYQRSLKCESGKVFI